MWAGVHVRACACVHACMCAELLAGQCVRTRTPRAPPAAAGVALTAANITAAGSITATSLLGYNITVTALP